MKCPSCGAETTEERCEYCGYQFPQEPKSSHTTIINNYYTDSQNHNASSKGSSKSVKYPQKSAVLALVLCIFLGFLGIHLFYTGKKKLGIAYIFTLGLFGIGWIVDIILIATGKFRDFHNQPLDRTGLVNIKNSKFYKKWWFWLIIVLLLLFGIINNITSKDSPDEGSAGFAVQTHEEATSEQEKESESLSPTETSTEELAESFTESTSVAAPLETAESTIQSDTSENIESTKDTIVYITDYGEKYHRISCRSLRESKHEISLSEAIAEGYTPCGICNPPT